MRVLHLSCTSKANVKERLKKGIGEERSMIGKQKKGSKNAAAAAATG